jgi:hypothetical protein
MLPYADTRTFLQKNPDCCKIVPFNVGDSGPYVSFFDQRLFGYAAEIVAATYVVAFFTADGRTKDATTTEQFAVTSCGRAWQ